MMIYLLEMVMFHSYVKKPKGSSFQWPSQDPKLEVPIPYIRPIF